MRESLSLEPLKEQTHRTIMQLYADSGERAMALAQFRSCKELLQHELEAQPDPETQRLADRIALRVEFEPSAVRQQISSAMAAEAPRTVVHAKTVPERSIAILPLVCIKQKKPNRMR